MTAQSQASETPRKSFSVREFAARNGICHVTAYKEINAGRLRSFKVGRARRISDEAEAEWIKRLEREAQA